MLVVGFGRSTEGRDEKIPQVRMKVSIELEKSDPSEPEQYWLVRDRGMRGLEE